MHGLQMKLAITKTYIGRICKGFDFLGFHFKSQGSNALALKSILHFFVRMLTLYEHGADDARIRMYIRRMRGAYYRVVPQAA